MATYFFDSFYSWGVTFKMDNLIYNMNWYIGQKVVCIDSSGQRLIEKNRVYTILGLKVNDCKCTNTTIFIGTFEGEGYTYCNKCKTRVYSKGESEVYYNDWRFAPINEIPESHEKEIEELLKETVNITNNNI